MDDEDDLLVQNIAFVRGGVEKLPTEANQHKTCNAHPTARGKDEVRNTSKEIAYSMGMLTISSSLEKGVHNRDVTCTSSTVLRGTST